MPWLDATEYAKKHNKKLKGHSAEVAAAAATSVLKKTGDEGKSIRIGNAAGNKVMKKKKSKISLKKGYVSHGKAF